MPHFDELDPQASLPQADYPTLSTLDAKTLPEGITLTTPKTVQALFDIADEHNHALKYFSGTCLSGEFFIFCLHQSDGTYFTFEYNAQPDHEDFKQRRHAVGLHNTPAPEALCRLADLVATHVLTVP